MVKVEKLIRPHLKELTSYSSARDEFKGEDGVLLDANENPYGNYNRYPDPCQNELKQEISDLKQVKTERIFLGNGSDEIIDLLFKLFCEPKNDKAIIFDPTFGMYETSAQINRVELVKIRLNESFQIDLDNQLKRRMKSVSTKMMFICSPNNPTGNVINLETVEYLLSTFEGMVVIDEAYIDFSETESWLRAIDDYSNLIVLQTMSKAWGLAGARIGMAFANVNIIRYLKKIKSPYNISSINQQAALKQLKNRQQYQKRIECILSERKKMVQALHDSRAVKKVFPTDANFILVKMNDADKVYNRLIDEGIIVRNRSQQVNNSLRITVGSPEENDYLINVFKKISI